MSKFTVPPELFDEMNEGNSVLFVSDALDEAGSPERVTGATAGFVVA